MPTATLTEPYLDSAVENLRECLRDLKTVIDGKTAVDARERCKDRLTKTASAVKELREERDGLLTEIGEKDQTIETLLAKLTKLDTLVEFVLDVDRRIKTGRELIDYVKLVYEPYPANGEQST